MKKSNICRLPTEVTSCAIGGRSDGEWHNSDHEQRLEIGGGISHSITSVAKDSYVFEPCILRMERTEEEKRRRHLYGDKGAKFRKGKQYEPMTDGCSRTITTFEHDNLLLSMESITKNILAISHMGHFGPEGVSGGTGYTEWDKLNVVYEDGEVVNISIDTYYATKKSIWEQFVDSVPYIGNPQESLQMLRDALKNIQPLDGDIPDNLLQIKYLFPEPQEGAKKFRYRIRKLTPRECLRLMGVRDADIDKIQLWPVGKDIKHPSYSKEERIANMTEDEKKRLMKSGISESRQYQLAGNSIVVDCLVNGIFKNLFIENDKPIETLF